MTGNMLKQPVMEHLEPYLYNTDECAQKIEDMGFFLGNHPYDAEEDLTEIHKLLSKEL